MSSEIKMSVSSLIRTEDKKAIYVMFEDGNKMAEITLPDLNVVRNNGFTEEEIRQLKDIQIMSGTRYSLWPRRSIH